MDRGQLKDAIEIVGMVAIVASLIFVGVQLRQEHVIAIGEVSAVTVANEAEIDIAIAEHAQTWRKLNDGDPLNEEETIAVDRLVNAMWRAVRAEAQMRRNLGTGGRSSILDFTIFLHRNPGARKIWEKQANEEIEFWEILAPGDPFRKQYRDEVLSELAKLARI